jgi:hypothetical protein
VAATKSSASRRRKQITCDDCFFRKHMLCALALDEPCSTFRHNTPEGLTPPRQPTLLLRGPAPVVESVARAA